MECPLCQAEIPDGAKFCYDCGNKIKNPETSLESKPPDKIEPVLEVEPHMFEGWTIEPQAKQGKSAWKILLTALLIILGVSGGYLYYARNSVFMTGDSDKSIQLNTYSNEKLGISFSYPLDCKTIDPDTSKTNQALTFMAAAPNSQTSIILLVQPLNKFDLSAEDQANGTVEYYKSIEGTSLKNYRKISYSSIDIGKYKGGFLDSEFTISQKNLTVRNRQLFVPTEQSTYILNMTTEDSNWNKNEPIFTAIVKSLKLK